MNKDQTKTYKRHLKLAKLNIDKVLELNETNRLKDAIKHLLDAYLLIYSKKI